MPIVHYDSGTSNSRIYLLGDDGNLLHTEKIRLARGIPPIAGGNAVLIDGLKELYDRMCAAVGLAIRIYPRYYASGTVTSRYGIKRRCRTCFWPISVSEFAGKCTVLRGTRLSPRNIPCAGLQNRGEGRRFYEEVSTMRGEEIEIAGAAGRDI